MKNYHSEEVSRRGKLYVFVTRGDSAPISLSEVEEYFGTLAKIPAKPFIPDDKRRVKMFLDDIRLGVDFCSAKYGAAKSEIIAEAKRLAPLWKFPGEQ